MAAIIQLGLGPGSSLLAGAIVLYSYLPVLVDPCLCQLLLRAQDEEYSGSHSSYQSVSDDEKEVLKEAFLTEVSSHREQSFFVQPAWLGRKAGGLLGMVSPVVNCLYQTLACISSQALCLRQQTMPSSAGNLLECMHVLSWLLDLLFMSSPSFAAPACVTG
jgi:hypothetical protein